MANMTEQLERKANGATKNMADKAQGFGGAMEKVSHDLGNKIGGVFSEVSEKANGYIGTTRSAVKDRPIQSVLIAAAAGAAVGTLVTMVASRKKH